MEYVKVVGLRAGYRGDVPFVATAAPALSWRVETDLPDWMQQGFEIMVERAGETQVFASSGDEQRFVPWPFAPLTSREQAAIRVRVLHPDGSAESDWSELLRVQAPLLEAADWSASMVAPPWPAEVELERGMPLLFKDFSIDHDIHCARLHVSAQGLYEMEINGQTVGDELLAPGWTKYDERLLYSTHDVTELLRTGDNRIGSWLAEGWYRGRFGFEGGARNRYGERIGVIAQLEVHCVEDHLHVIGTDGSWQVVTGPIVSTNLYDGETFDARRHNPAWSLSAAALEGVSAEVLEFDTATLTPMPMPPIRRHEELRVQQVIRHRGNDWLLDFGQNASGRVRLTIDASAGQVIEIGHAEVLEHGELGTRPLRQAASIDRYIADGKGPTTWEPRFAIHGFRYAEVRNAPANFSIDDISMLVCHSDIERIGDFTCSHELVNRLHHNVVWGTKSNFVSIPTDCPQRDERLGWTGDIAAFVETASFLYDVDGFLSSWLADLSLEQRKHDCVPVYVPYIPSAFPVAPMALWGDAAVMVPNALFDKFGDVEVLEQQYPSMCAWVDLVASSLDGDCVWRQGMQLGDWLDPTAPPDRPADARTQNKLVATAFAFMSARRLASMAQVLGREIDAATYADLAAHIRRGFRDEYITANGRMASDAQTAFAIAIMFDLLQPEQIAGAARRFTELVLLDGFRIGTGFAGTPLMCHALTKIGRADLAYAMLLQTECPSWLYPVTMGATTIWERWDSMLPNGDINPGDMTSFNHYALGAVADWLHSTVAGIAAAAPGYKRIRFAPIPGGGLTHASAGILTPYGPATIAWKRSGEQLRINMVVPPNTTAELHLPSGERQVLGSGAHGVEVTYQDPSVDLVNAQPLDRFASMFI